MSRAVLSLGSNLGDRMFYLGLAVDGFTDVLVSASPVYETESWGVRDQPDFLNAVLVVEAPDVDEWGWLHRAQERERAAGRVRTERWGPRTLDVDVVAVDEIHSGHPGLRLPHPGTADRATVLIPWLAADSWAQLPGSGAVSDLVAKLPAEDVAGVRLRPDLRLR